MFLDHEKFYRECDRVLVPGGVIAAFTYDCQEHRVVEHPNAEKLSRIMNEIPEKASSAQDLESSEYSMIIIKKYTYPNIQIPYTDRKRIDNVYMTIDSTIVGFLKLCLSASFVRNYVNSCNENMAWWRSCEERLMDAYGTADPKAPLTYQMEVFMLLGRKS
ncbi:hypothetical protein EB796_008322 [Bugula neritina]|uniref:Uncharacterized protein n=1 Tax=Bugula neritina TaxID=10212 RepID=A0A7J7K414_BUGNE|nr:hypothetical protein EB796_008322 [Bugula neritina]